MILKIQIIDKTANRMAFCKFNPTKKLLREWNAATANSELVFSATNPIPQLPNSKMKKKTIFEVDNSKFKCQINHKTAINNIPINFGSGDNKCCRNPRQPISSNNP